MDKSFKTYNKCDTTCAVVISQKRGSPTAQKALKSLHFLHILL
jgi:hypothetical protein